MIAAILAILSFALQNLCCKEYGRRYPSTLYAQAVMALFCTIVVAIIMACLGGVAPLTPSGYLIAFSFGTWFVITLSVMTLAINYGHMGVTLLIQNASLVVPVLFGILFWNEKLTLWKGIGTACILILLYLSVNGTDDAADEETKKHWNKKLWIIFTALAFIGDSVLSILQTAMSRECENVTAVTFTFWTSIFSILVSLLIIGYCFLRKQTQSLRSTAKDRWIFPGLCAMIGIGTAGGNCFSIMALLTLPSIVMFPFRMGGLVLVMWVLGVLVYKEKITRRGLLMLAVGLLGIILLNI